MSFSVLSWVFDESYLLAVVAPSLLLGVDVELSALWYWQRRSKVRQLAQDEESAETVAIQESTLDEDIPVLTDVVELGVDGIANLFVGIPVLTDVVEHGGSDPFEKLVKSAPEMEVSLNSLESSPPAQAGARHVEIDDGFASFDDFVLPIHHEVLQGAADEPAKPALAVIPLVPVEEDASILPNQEAEVSSLPIVTIQVVPVAVPPLKPSAEVLWLNRWNTAIRQRDAIAREIESLVAERPR